MNILVFKTIVHELDNLIPSGIKTFSLFEFLFPLRSIINEIQEDINYPII